MAKLILVISLFLGVNAQALKSDLTLKYFVNGAYVSVVMKKIGKVQVSENCYKKKDTCRALKVLKSKPVAQKPTESRGGNPGANYCWEVGAKNRILKDDKNNQYDYCVFEDGSMIDGWALYGAHHPAPTIR